MQAVRSFGSDIEIRLGRALWMAGFRYRRNNRGIFGNPDFTLRKKKIAIFADSEFWHGKDWARRKHQHKSNIEFWHNKIGANRKRDQLVNRTLRAQGWAVVRFWGKEIIRDVDSCVAVVRDVVATRI